MNDSNRYNYQSADDYPLKWHKFLIYFSLWASAITNAIQGLSAITGMPYGADSETIYRYFPQLRSVNVVMGFALIALAIYTIFVRFQLAGFRRGAPQKLVGLYIAFIVFDVAYLLITAATTGLSVGELIDSQYVGAIVSSAVMAGINRVYYGKREALFIN